MRDRLHMRLLPLFLLLMARLLHAQSCPPADGKSPDAPAASVLHGTIMLHPGVRPWLGLFLEQPACGNNEIELAFAEHDSWTQATRLNHCGAMVKGLLSESLTAYYSADLNIFNPQITADSSCRLLPAGPDVSRRPAPTDLKTYRATVFVDTLHDKPLRGKVSTEGKPLQPWRAYVKTSLNAEKDLDLSCRDGFKLASFKGSGSQAELFDTYTARLDANDKAPASLTITCHRNK